MKALPLLLFVSYLSTFACLLMGGDRPNVVMIVVDDLHPGVAKGWFDEIHTPAIDRLRQEGVYFVNAACNTPVCNPSRSSFFSGLYPHTTGAYLNGSDGWNRSELLMEIRNIPETFKDNGYATWGAGKILHNPLSEEREAGMWDNFPVYKGGFGPFDEAKTGLFISRFRSIKAWEGPDSDFPDVKNADGAIEFLSQNHDKPFFLYYGLWRPHSPYTAPKRFFEQYEELVFRFPPGTVSGDLEDVPELGRLLTDGLRGYHVDGMSEDEVKQAFLNAYAANTTFTDWNVGRVLAALEASPYADNTIVVFFSDNGFHTTEKERWGKATLWDLSANISLIIKIPESKPAVVPATVSLVDVFPTLIEYCGLKPPHQPLDGVSFLPQVLDSSHPWHRPSLTSYGMNYSSVRDEDYRYIRYPDGTEEIYRYTDDPFEFRNLADDPAFDFVRQKLKPFIPTRWARTTGGRLEVRQDYDKVLRPRAGEWDVGPTDGS